MTTTVNDYINKVIGRMPSATPRRDQIEMELRGQIAERMDRGQSIDDVVRPRRSSTCS